MKISPGSASQAGLFRRLLAGWRRFEEAMDYAPLDHTNDRVRGLEARIEQLEQRLGAMLKDPSARTSRLAVRPRSSQPR